MQRVVVGIVAHWASLKIEKQEKVKRCHGFVIKMEESLQCGEEINWRYKMVQIPNPESQSIIDSIYSLCTCIRVFHILFQCSTTCSSESSTRSIADAVFFYLITDLPHNNAPLHSYPLPLYHCTTCTTEMNYVGPSSTIQYMNICPCASHFQFPSVDTIHQQLTHPSIYLFNMLTISTITITLRHLVTMILEQCKSHSQLLSSIKSIY